MTTMGVRRAIARDAGCAPDDVELTFGDDTPYPDPDRWRAAHASELVSLLAYYADACAACAEALAVARAGGRVYLAQDGDCPWFAYVRPKEESR